MSYKFGNSSKAKLAEVHDDLQFASDKALKNYSTVDYGVICGARTVAEQKEILAAGDSHVIRSRHIPVTPKLPPLFPSAKTKKNGGKIEDKISHAIDIMCYVNGKGTWAEEHYYAVAEAYRIVAVKHDIAIRWGGCWKDLRKVASIHSAVEDYKQWCKDQFKAGKRKDDKPFLDIGHFELDIRSYPRVEK